MALDPGNVWIETYIALVAYYVLHMIFVIAGDFIEAFGIPPLNIGIYIDKLAAIRALLMAIADVLEWGITQKACSSFSTTARVVGAMIWFIAMLILRLVYLWLVYYSENKSLSVFITLTVEGFWFGFFQMGFFAIGPEYNAFTTLALHFTGNFVFFFQIILNKLAASRPGITCTYRVRIHAWIAFLSTLIALPQWVWFLFLGRIISIKGPDFGLEKALSKLEDAARVVVAAGSKLADVGTEAGNLKRALKNNMLIDLKIEGLGEVGTKAGELKSKIGEVKHDKITGAENNKKVKAALGGVAYNAGELAAALKLISGLIDGEEAAGKLDGLKGAANLKTGAIDTGETAGGGSDAVWSPMLLFPVGSVIKDFMYPGILPFAFLDPERANLVNYTMPVFYMTGAFFVLLVNDVFSGANGFAGNPSLDCHFKKWSENEGDGRYYHGFWALNLVMLATLVVALLSIHGIYPRLRCLVQCRWRIMLMTLGVLIPRSFTECMGYVGVANYAIFSHNFDTITGHDVLAMFCRFANGKLAVGYK